MQFIDVRDLAAGIITAGHHGLTGAFNAVGTQRELAAILSAAQKVAGHDAELITADDDWLVAHGDNHWAGPHSLPLWLPRSANALFQRSRERFLESGGTERTVHETLRDVLADERARGLHRERRAGLTRDDEVRLISELSELGEG